MNTIHRALLISIVPLLTPLTSLAQGDTRTGSNTSVQDGKGSVATWRASHVIGLDVKNSASESIGKVEDLIIDMKNGEIIAVVISSGGFLGLGESHSAVPVQVLRYDERAEGFKTKLTKEQLGKAPQFQADEWPDYSEATTSQALRTYRDSVGGDVDPTDTTNRNNNPREENSATRNGNNATRNQNRDDNANRDNTADRDADNSERNDQARRDDFVSPTDQGNSDKDIQMTKDIRAGIMDKDLSFNAKNIKVITRNERVTLNGVVESDAERQAILMVVANHCDQSRVIDNLTVKTD